MTTNDRRSKVNTRHSVGAEEYSRLVEIWRRAVDARQRGQGIGSALLERVVAECGVTTVDVNEQNAQFNLSPHDCVAVAVGYP